MRIPTSGVRAWCVPTLRTVIGVDDFCSRLFGCRMSLLARECSVAVPFRGIEPISCGEADWQRAYTGCGVKRGCEQFSSRECSVAVLCSMADFDSNLRGATYDEPKISMRQCNTYSCLRSGSSSSSNSSSNSECISYEIRSNNNSSNSCRSTIK